MSGIEKAMIGTLRFCVTNVVVVERATAPPNLASCRIEGGLGAGTSAEVGKKVIMEMGEAGLDRGKACKAIPESNRLGLMKTGHFWRPV